MNKLKIYRTYCFGHCLFGIVNCLESFDFAQDGSKDGE